MMRKIEQSSVHLQKYVPPKVLVDDAAVTVGTCLMPQSIRVLFQKLDLSAHTAPRIEKREELVPAETIPNNA